MININVEVVRVISHRDRLLKLMESLSPETALEVLGNITEVKSMMEARIEQRKIKEDKKQSSIEEVKLMMEKLGLSDADFDDSSESNKVIPKYVFVAEDGHKHTYSGFGRKPRWLVEQITNNGKSESDFLNPDYL